MSTPSHMSPGGPVDIGILTVISPELDAVRAALGLADDARHKPGANDTTYFFGSVDSALRKRSYSVALAAIGWAGTSGAAALASQMNERHKPRLVVLVGIAAGMRGKVKIGDVVLCDRVVAYEPAALTVDANGSPTTQSRPETSRITPGILSDMVAYRPDETRFGRTFGRISGAFPKAPAGKIKEYKKHVASVVRCCKQVTVASGDKLLRYPNKLVELRLNVHGKIEAGEMEAAGLVEACHLAGKPWLMIRGISDFADDFKNDDFHRFASQTAATVLLDFLQHGLDLGDEAGTPLPTAAAAKAGFRGCFSHGAPIQRAEDFMGRQAEGTAILDAVAKGPVQILGGALSGKSSLLRWVERSMPRERPVVWIAGQGHSPAMLVAAIARALKQPTLAAELEGRDADTELAKQVLGKLGRFALLIDEADKLASAKGYSEDFFQYVRSRIEDGMLWWVSTSRQNLYEVFKQRGLTSRFLQSSKKIWLGPLEAEAAQALASRAGSAHAERMLAEAGGFAYGLQWLGAQLLEGGGDVDDVCLAFRREMKDVVFSSWWAGLEDAQREMLRKCVKAPVRASAEEEEQRECLSALAERGYLVKDGAGYRLCAGAAWQEFVRRAK